MRGQSPQMIITVSLIGVIALMIASFPSLAVLASAQSDNNSGASPKNANIICSKAITQQQGENPQRALPSFCRDVVAEPECTLQITTDQETYGPGDTIRITVTNTGSETLVFPDAGLGLEIVNLDTGVVLDLVFAQVVTELLPGESKTFEFRYESLVSEIGTGTIKASVGDRDQCASVTFTLAPSSSD
jgi:hypothetical protein